MRKNYWQGKNIKLRAVEDKDLNMYLENRSNPDSVREWFEDSIQFPESEAGIRKSFTEMLEEFSKDDKRIFVIETLEGDYVGEISVWHTQRRQGIFKYGIFLEESFRGKGYGKQALVIVIDYYLNELNYNKVNATVYSYNNNSQTFHEKFGFVKEGIIRQDIYSRGEYHDMIHYGMLKNEFNNLYKHEFIGM